MVNGRACDPGAPLSKVFIQTIECFPPCCSCTRSASQWSFVEQGNSHTGSTQMAVAPQALIRMETINVAISNILAEINSLGIYENLEECEEN